MADIITSRKLQAEFGRLALNKGLTFTEQEGTRAIRYLCEYLTDWLAAGGRVEIRGFGSFGAKEFEERMARNPQDGSLVHAPARARIYFKAGKILAERVNRAKEKEKAAAEAAAQADAFHGADED